MSSFLQDLEVVGGFAALCFAAARYVARKPEEDLHQHRGKLNLLIVLSVGAFLTGYISLHNISAHQQQLQDKATQNCEQEALREAPVQPVQLDRAGGIARLNDDGTFFLAEIVFSPSQRYEASFGCTTDSSGNVAGLINYSSNFGGGPNP